MDSSHHVSELSFRNMDFQDPSEIVRSMEGKSVLVIGDVMLDRYVYGSVHRISPESPIPVLSIARESMMLGGAANTLASLVGLGARPSLLAVVGADDAAYSLREKLQEVGVKDDGLVIDIHRPTTVKTRFLAGHQQMLRTDFEKKGPISDSIVDAIKARAKTLIQDVQVLVLSDYGKGLLRADLIADLIALAKEHGIPVIVDPKGHDYSIYKGASAVTPNKKELSEAVGGAAVDSDEAVIDAALKLISTAGVEAVVATRSNEGMSVVYADRDPVHLRTVDIEVFDVSGAGDVVVATIAASIAAGADLAHAAGLANVAGSIAVSKVGTTPIRVDELLEALQSDDADIQTRVAKGLDVEKARGDRVRQAGSYSWDEAEEQVRRWKARGLKVGLTNGCFDILHKGHVTYLNDARNGCDRLIVALNHDDSVRLLKGEERPIHDEDARASVIGALGSVDMVVFFGAREAGLDNTASAVIDRLEPDVYFKGGDYKVEDLPEADHVFQYGGQVEIMPIYEGHSTTSSLQKMKGEAA